MTKRAKTSLRFASALLFLLAACGCTSLDLTELYTVTAPEIIEEFQEQEEPLPLPAPTVEKVQSVAAEPTVLEQYQEACRLLELERARASELSMNLEEETKLRKQAETQVEETTRKLKRFTEQKADLDRIAQQYQEAQEKLLHLANESRNLRHDLLKGKLALVAREQEIVKLQIEMVKAKRRQLLNQAIGEGARATSAAPVLD